MKVTFVLPFVNLTGGIRVMLDYANWLHDRGHDVTVAYPSWPYRFQLTRRQQWSEFRKQVGTDVRVPWFHLRCSLLRVPLIRTRFLPRADLVVATAWPTVREVAGLSPSCGKKVHVVMHHESGTGPERRIQQIYQYPFYRIAFSDSVRETIQNRFRCTIQAVVPNGVNTELFFPDGQPIRRSVLFLYHPDPRKGAKDGIEVLTQLRRRLPDLEVRVCGTVWTSHLPTGVPFEFHPPDAVLRRRYSKATALLYPSRHEGFGLPPLEAMACGCPSVTTTVGAVPEYASDRRNAILVRIGDIGGMVDGLHELLTCESLRDSLSAEGLRTVATWSLARVAPLFAEALRDAYAS